ncbi:MAG TPA: hypothetical protein DCZ43_05105 [candidate division Zixibacteria bacterium]|nr:hypothetical protein [candidate division Zixibacteria bacterium]
MQAVLNWWGDTPRPHLIDGNIQYIPELTYDPLRGLDRREAPSWVLPTGISLLQNIPNPFNPTTEISFYLDQGGQAILKVYNITGQLVKTLVSDNLSLGKHRIIWDGKNSLGIDVASGVYFYVLTSGTERTSKSMTLLR